MIFSVKYFSAPTPICALMLICAVCIFCTNVPFAFQATSAALAGNLGEAIALLNDAAAGSNPKKIKQISKVKRYLRNNADGLGPGPSLGAIESNVDKLVANRMKKRGMAWSIAGARKMLKLLEKKVTEGWVDLLVAPKEPVPIIETQPRQIIEATTHDPEAWLRVHIAAFDGPHAGRPWVKLLREIARGQELQLTGIVPTKT